MVLQPFVGPWPLLHFRNLFYTEVVLFGRVISPSQGLYLHAGQRKHRINAHTNIHELSGFRTHDPSVRANEDSPCLDHAAIVIGTSQMVVLLYSGSFAILKFTQYFTISLYYFAKLKFSSVHIILLQIFISNSRYIKCVA
jgi:hypothetical protein